MWNENWPILFRILKIAFTPLHCDKNSYFDSIWCWFKMMKRSAKQAINFYSRSSLEKSSFTLNSDDSWIFFFVFITTLHHRNLHKNDLDHKKFNNLIKKRNIFGHVSLNLWKTMLLTPTHICIASMPHHIHNNIIIIIIIFSKMRKYVISRIFYFHSIVCEQVKIVNRAIKKKNTGHQQQ